MKLFKKVLAVVLVGAMAVSMLTACGESAKTADIKSALKKAGVSVSSTMNKEADGAMDALQAVTVALKEGDADAVSNAQAKIAQMKEFSFTNDANAKYDLYIWTNSVYGRPGKSGPNGYYPYLMKFTSEHTGTRLQTLLTEKFVRQGEFKGADSDLEVLKKVLKGVPKAGISCQKVYGMDVLIVVVDRDAPVKDYTCITIDD